MHIHIHWLIHAIRHARLMGWSMRLLGTMVLTLLFSLFQFAAEPAWAGSAEKDSRRCAIGISRSDCSPAMRVLGSGSFGVDPADPGPPHAVNTNAYAGVFSRLKPRIVMIPRMNRVPKPKSVYRISARAPGSNSDSLNEAFHREAS